MMLRDVSGSGSEVIGPLRNLSFLEMPHRVILSRVISSLRSTLSFLPVLVSLWFLTLVPDSSLSL